jgi:hypothetical protein
MQKVSPSRSTWSTDRFTCRRSRGSHVAAGRREVVPINAGTPCRHPRFGPGWRFQGHRPPRCRISEPRESSQRWTSVNPSRNAGCEPRCWGGGSNSPFRQVSSSHISRPPPTRWPHPSIPHRLGVPSLLGRRLQKCPARGEDAEKVERHADSLPETLPALQGPSQRDAARSLSSLMTHLPSDAHPFHHRRRRVPRVGAT